MSPPALFALVAAVGIVITGLGFVLGFWDRLDEDRPEDFAAPENPFRPFEE